MSEEGQSQWRLPSSKTFLLMLLLPPSAFAEDLFSPSHFLNDDAIKVPSFHVFSRPLFSDLLPVVQHA